MSPSAKFNVTPEVLDEFKKALMQVNPDIDAHLIAGGEEGLNTRTLTRWLVARKGHLQVAVKDLSDHAAWRLKHVPKGQIPEEAVLTELSQDKAFAIRCDKQGHPTLIARVKNHKIAKKHEDFENMMIYLLDMAVQMGQQEEKQSGKAWDGKVIGILDLRDISLSNCDTSGLLTIFRLLQNHYVERLYKMYLYCAPTIFYGVWKVVHPFLDPVTAKKVQFVSAKEAATAFAAEFDNSVLPSEFGGSGTARPALEVRRELASAMQQTSTQAPQQGEPGEAVKATEAEAVKAAESGEAVKATEAVDAVKATEAVDAVKATEAVDAVEPVKATE